MIPSRIFKWIAGATLISVLVATLALALPTGAVAAQSNTPPTATPAAGADAGKQVTTRLERMFVRVNRILERQTKILDKVDDLIVKVEDRIAKAKANGKDITTAQAAVDVFKNVVSKARIAHTSALATMVSHPGFDANGKVIEVAQARETITSVVSGTREERKDFRQAFKDFRQALRDIRKSNKVSSDPNS